MIIQLHKNGEAAAIIEKLQARGLSTTLVITQSSRYIVALGKQTFDIREIGVLPGVSDVFVVNDPYQLVSRAWRVHPTSIDLGDGVKIEEGKLSLMMGPCSVESEEQIESVVKFLHSQGVRILRGGAFKPRSSPYTFRGLGIPGLKLMSERAHSYGIKVISEVLEPSQIAQMYDYVDIYQVGARNNQNFNLLHELGTVDKPVLIKRGMSGTLEELLQSAEYVYANGNERIMLCERGIRTFERSYRNVFDINAIPLLKEKSHLPVIADPSHGIGIRRHVEPIALAGAIAGADGILIEIHETPEQALSDAQQTLNYQEASELIEKLRKIEAIR